MTFITFTIVVWATVAAAAIATGAATSAAIQLNHANGALFS